MAEQVVINSIQLMTQAVAELDKTLEKHGWTRRNSVELRQTVNGYLVHIDIDERTED